MMARSLLVATLALAALALGADARKLLQDDAAALDPYAAGAEEGGAAEDCTPLLQYLEENPDQGKKLKKFAKLVTALDVDVASLDESGEGLTIFAPSNKAFKEALEAVGVTEDQLTESEEAKALVLDVLSMHVVKGRYGASDLTAATEPIELETMLEGEMLSASVEDQNVVVAGSENEAVVTKPDALDVCEGVVHQIDTLLLPAGAVDSLMALAEGEGGEGDAEGGAEADAEADAGGGEMEAGVGEMEGEAEEEPAAADAQAEPAIEPAGQPADQPPTRR